MVILQKTLLKLAPIEWKACEVRTTWKESGNDVYKKAQAICFQKKTPQNQMSSAKFTIL
jgi:hypothetical protein